MKWRVGTNLKGVVAMAMALWPTASIVNRRPVDKDLEPGFVERPDEEAKQGGSLRELETNERSAIGQGEIGAVEEDRL